MCEDCIEEGFSYPTPASMRVQACYLCGESMLAYVNESGETYYRCYHCRVSYP